jgi:hypothetical protein
VPSNDGFCVNQIEKQPGSSSAAGLLRFIPLALFLWQIVLAEE